MDSVDKSAAPHVSLSTPSRAGVDGVDAHSVCGRVAGYAGMDGFTGIQWGVQARRSSPNLNNGSSPGGRLTGNSDPDSSLVTGVFKGGCSGN